MTRPDQFILIHLEHSFLLSIKMGQPGNYAPLHHEEICSGWSIFGYQNPALLVNFRLSKPAKASSLQQERQKPNSRYPTHLIVRFENAPEDVLDKLTPYWGKFEWILDEKPPV